MNKRRLDMLITKLVAVRQEVVNNPEIELDLDRELNVVETSIQLLCEVVEEELKE